MWSIQQISEHEWQVLRDGVVVEVPTIDGETALSAASYDLAVAFIAAQLADAPTITEPGDGTTADGLLAESWVDDEGIFFSEPTGDGRDFTQCQWTWRDPAAVPVPLMLQTCTDIGHFGAQLAGFAEQISQNSGTGHASGRFYDSEIGRQFRDMLLGGRSFGVSVDPGAVDATFECVEEDEEGWCLEERIDFQAYQVIGITGTPFAGFERAKIKLSGGAVTAAATSFESLPLSDRAASWDTDAALDRVRRLCSSDGSGEQATIDWSQYQQAFFWYDVANAETFAGYQLPFADVESDALTANWSAVAAAAGALEGDVIEIPEADVDGVRSHVASYYAAAAEQYDDDTLTPPWEEQSALADDNADNADDTPDPTMMPEITDHEFVDDGNGFCSFCVNEQDNECLQQCGAVESIHGDTAGGDGEGDGSMQAAAATVLSIPLSPPRDWMTLPEPQLGDQGGHELYGAAISELLVEQPDGGVAVPLQILDNGLVFGHLARWGQQHVGYPGRRVTPPQSESAYAHFNVGHVVCDDGSSVATGTLVVGCEHAPLRGISALEARDYYAHSGFGWANVHVSTGNYGPWACGVLRPDVTAEQIRVLRSLAPSGDWRQIGRSLDLIGTLMVNVPGFPVAREAITASGFEPVEPVRVAGVIEHGQTTALVAAGMVYRCAECAQRQRALAQQHHEPEGLPEMLARRLDRMDGRLGVIERRTQHLLAPGRDDLRRRIFRSTQTSQ